jgi:lysophospholipase
MDLIVTPDNPVPPGAVASAARTIDGLSIRVARWHPPGVPRGAVVLAQGRAEFIEKYFETVGDLLARGFAVVTFDWRGQGLSARQVENPRKGHVDDFLIYERDLDAVIEQAVAPFCPKPWFALAHSTGAAILLAQARRGRSPFARIVMTSPLIDIAGLPFPEGARMLADLLNVVGLGGAFVPGGKASSLLALPFAGNKLTSDERRYKRNAAVAAAEPRVAIGAPTIGWLNAAFRRIEPGQLEMF